jgi:hypothetical protein
MFRGHVPPFQAGKARAIVILDGQKSGPVLRGYPLAKQAWGFCLEWAGRSWHRRCDPGRVHRLLYPRCEQCIALKKPDSLTASLIHRQSNRTTYVSSMSTWIETRCPEAAQNKSHHER